MSEVPVEPSQPQQQQKKAVQITSVDFQKIDIRVGLLKEVHNHPDSEKIYCEKIDIGESEPRQIGSGLRQFVKIEDMEGLVLVIANLKPRKLAGFESNGMVLCASNQDHSQVELIRPHPDSKVGERVFLQDLVFPQEFEKVLNPKHKVTENVLPFCKTDENLCATFQGVKMMTSAGEIKCQTLKDAHIS